MVSRGAGMQSRVYGGYRRHGWTRQAPSLLPRLNLAEFRCSANTIDILFAGLSGPFYTPGSAMSPVLSTRWLKVATVLLARILASNLPYPSAQPSRLCAHDSTVHFGTYILGCIGRTGICKPTNAQPTKMVAGTTPENNPPRIADVSKAGNASMHA
jgi:hypothetical protein